MVLHTGCDGVLPVLQLGIGLGNVLSPSFSNVARYVDSGRVEVY